MAEAVALIESGRVNTDAMLGEVFDLDGIEDAMALLARRDPTRDAVRVGIRHRGSSRMSLFGLRFDFRNPDFAGTDMTERYRAALDMAEWADRLGFVTIVLSEHHGSPDGYLPSPVAMAAAMAARHEQRAAAARRARSRPSTIPFASPRTSRSSTSSARGVST